ncbi:MAG: PKD domain-containing protein [Chitinispirillia bacterium]|nr:PKD domain-containing protein [Chitinispirillia bacterium]
MTASCTLREEGPEVQIVVGEASLLRNGKVQPLTAGLKLKLWDSLTVAPGSKIKIAAGLGTVYVNERSNLQLTRTTGVEDIALVAHSGELHFVMRDGSHAVCRTGDAFITIRNADAALSVAPSGKSAQIAVLRGEALVNRSGEETRVISCTKAFIEPASAPQKEVIQADEVERLKEWVGKSVIEKAVASARCRIQQVAAAPQPEPVETAAATVSVIMAESPPQIPARPRQIILPPVDTVSEEPPKVYEPAVKTPEPKPEPEPAPVVITTPVPAPVPVSAAAPRITIDYLSGPRQAFAGQEMVFKVGVSAGAPKEFLWRFKLGAEVIEKKSAVPQVSIKLEKAGDYTLICEVIGEKGGRVSQQIAVKIVNSPVIADAGGPYKAMVNTPVKFRGSAESRFSNLVLYEWHIGGSPAPAFSSATPAAFDHTFTKSGKHQVIFSVRAANGAVGSDTITVDVSTQAPVANAGEDIVSRAGRRVRLRGTGAVPGGGEIVKYEWDFNGSGIFDWSSATTGTVQHVFNAYATPVLRVTNSLGVSATDTMRVVICPEGMVTAEQGRFCIDQYEWPNSRGTVPHVNMSWHEAVQACQSAGKRLCTSSEWQGACRNDRTQRQAGRRVYPYGTDFDKNRCNTLGNFKTKNRLSASGIYNDCAGSLSVFDMSGNASEWVDSNDGATAPAYGGFYQSGANDSNCDSFVTLDKNRKYFYVGFRCCK